MAPQKKKRHLRTHETHQTDRALRGFDERGVKRALRLRTEVRAYLASKKKRKKRKKTKTDREC